MVATLVIVQQIIAEQLDLPIEQVKQESLIKEDLDADSLEKVEIIIQFEDKFGVIIHDKESEKIKTVGDAANAIDELLTEVKAL